MESSIPEASYPITFRKEDSRCLSDHITNRHNVVLIGMKRVGINSFLRFFLYHPQVHSTYLKKGDDHFFIPVDLYDLVEIEIFPFWMLTLKRILDTVEDSNLDQDSKRYISKSFLDSIQSKDLFLLIDKVRGCLLKIIEKGLVPTIFFSRFDRMQNAATEEFFSNLRGLKEATHNKASFVFTSFRSLDELSPQVFKKASIAVFAHEMYLQPATKQDTKIIAEADKKRYQLNLSPEVEEKLLDLVDGYTRFLELGFIILSTSNTKKLKATNLFDLLTKDERINLQSEELWETLTKKEQDVLVNLVNGQNLTWDDKDQTSYLWHTGFVKDNQDKIFSSLFEHYLKTLEQNKNITNGVDFTNKEQKLFNFLKDNINQVCERESIISTVWPEEEELGVTDWAVDRLMARVRGKLKQQNNPYEVVTIKTRGYKLIQTTGLFS